MRAFLSSSKLLVLFLTVALPLVLTGCNEEKVGEKKEEKKKTEAPAAPKKEEKKAEQPKKSAQNFKLDQEPDEPALATLLKLDPNHVVARVEGEEITIAQLIEAVKSSPDQIKSLPLSKIYTSMVKRLRDMHALVKASAKAGVDKIADVQKKIQEASDAVKVKHFVDEKMSAKITPEFLKKQFDEFMKVYKKDGKSEKEFRLMVAIVKDKKSAEDVLLRVKKGEKFEDLVMEVSTDDKVKETKGELGYVRFSELPKELAEKVQKAATGVIVDSAIELGKDKWAVFKKMDQRDVPDPTFEEVAPDLKKVVMPQFFSEVLADVLKETTSEIIDYKTGQPMDEKAEEAKAKAEIEKTEKASKAPSSDDSKAPLDASKKGDKSSTPIAKPSA